MNGMMDRKMDGRKERLKRGQIWKKEGTYLEGGRKTKSEER